MPAITTDEVQKVAVLARLEFKEEEIQQFTAQLSRVLDYIEKLDELDTTEIPPTSHIVPLRNIVTKDIAKPSYARNLVLATAPATTEGYFEVPKAIE